MSDEPLFKDADKEEALYAPEGSENDRSDGPDVPGAGVVVPAAGFATVGGAMGGSAGGTGGPTGIAAAGPAVAGAALTGELDDDSNDNRPRSGVAEGANDAAGQTSSG